MRVVEEVSPLVVSSLYKNRLHVGTIQRHSNTISAAWKRYTIKKLPRGGIFNCSVICIVVTCQLYYLDSSLLVKTREKGYTNIISDFK